MSYILDALRRADAERDRGRVPGIHAQVPPPAADDPAPRRGGASPWRWIALGAGLGLLVVFAAWWWLGRETAPAMPPVATMNPPPPIPQPEARPMPPPGAPLPPPTTAAERPAEAPAPIEQRPTAEAAAAAARKVAAAASRPALPASAPAGALPAAAGTPGASAPQGAARIYGRHELPDEIRRQLPAVTIGGSIYSPNPANRFVVINGQVVHEGGTIGPDHVLESIRLKSAVLRFQGYRYELLF